MKRLKVLALIGLAAQFTEQAYQWGMEAQYRHLEGADPSTAYREELRLQRLADKCKELANKLDQQSAPAGAPF